MLSRGKLKKLLQEHGIMAKVHSNFYRPVIETNRPAKQPGGRDVIVSYYDGNRYICTKHRVIIGIWDEAEEVHQDVEAAVIDGVHYERGPDTETP